MLTHYPSVVIRGDIYDTKRRLEAGDLRAGRREGGGRMLCRTKNQVNVAKYRGVRSTRELLIIMIKGKKLPS